MGELKKRFVDEVLNTPLGEMDEVSYLVVAVKLPTGAIELIMNTDDLWTKAMYYKNQYDDNFRLRANPDIRIVGYMLV